MLDQGLLHGLLIGHLKSTEIPFITTFHGTYGTENFFKKNITV